MSFPAGARLFYVAGGVDAIFPSQVDELLREISRRRIFSEVVLVCGDAGDRDLPERGGEGAYGVVRFRALPRYPLLDQAVGARMRGVIGRLHVGAGDVIHVRGGELGGLLLQSLPRLGRNTLVDVRGARREEIREFGSGFAPLRLAKGLGADLCLRGLRRAAYASVVSVELGRYVKDLAGPSTVISVNHTVAGRGFRFDAGRREAVRAELGVAGGERLAVFSTGGGSAWQQTERIAGLLAEVPGVRVLVLARGSVEGSKIIRRFVPYSEVPGYLSAADLGVILREPSVVNRVACPIKFSEYLACGLPVVADTSVSLIEETIARHGVGRIVETPVEAGGLRDAVTAVRTIDRAAVSDVGRRTFGVRAVADGYVGLYARMLAGGAGD